MLLTISQVSAGSYKHTSERWSGPPPNFLISFSSIPSIFLSVRHSRTRINKKSKNAEIAVLWGHGLQPHVRVLKYLQAEIRWFRTNKARSWGGQKRITYGSRVWSTRKDRGCRGRAPPRSLDSSCAVAYCGSEPRVAKEHQREDGRRTVGDGARTDRQRRRIVGSILGGLNFVLVWLIHS
jgi:hypothetical protein